MKNRKPNTWAKRLFESPRPATEAPPADGHPSPESGPPAESNESWAARLFRGEPPLPSAKAGLQDPRSRAPEPETAPVDATPETAAGSLALAAAPELLHPRETELPLPSNEADTRHAPEPWSGGQTTLRVAAVIEETPDARTFRLVGAEPRLFSYRPGQFVTLLLNLDGQAVQRSYSLSSSPSRPHTVDLTVKRVPGGLVSNWLCDRVRPGDVLQVRGPSGQFTCFEHPADKLLFIAAGSGLTPILSMCRWIVDTAADVDVKLLASFRTAEDILFRRELEWLSTRHDRFQAALTLTGPRPGAAGWTGLTGRIGIPMIRWLAPDLHQRHVFLCGPEAFMDGVRAALRELDFDFSRLHSESFGGGRLAPGAGSGAAALPLTAPLHQVRFAKSGLTVTTDERITLLELAEAHGIAIEYSCRSGSCGECEIKCQGPVEHAKDCGIDAQTLAAGLVYACSCRARGNLVVEA